MRIFLYYILYIVLIPLSVTENTYAHEIAPETPSRFTSDDWFNAPHPRVSTFGVDGAGNASGITETGIPFSQYTIYDENGIRIQKFEMQDHAHYIVNGEIVYSSEELSARLAQNY